MALTEYKKLESINISKNYLSDVCAKNLAKMIEVNLNLKVLLAHYNRFMGKGGDFIAKAIQKS